MSDPGHFATLPAPPYYVVVFSSQRRDGDDGYGAMAERMVELAASQPGFLGVESARDATGFGITTSYWTSLDAIAAWKRHSAHLVAQRRGRQDWYARFELRVARVERASGGP